MSAQNPAASTEPPFVLPFNRAVNANQLGAFRITNLGANDGSIAVWGEGRVGLQGKTTLPSNGKGVVGLASGQQSFAVYGFSEKEGVGVYGENSSDDNDGVRGVGLRGVRGVSVTEGGAGVVGVFRAGVGGPTSAEALNPTFQGRQPDFKTRGWLATHVNGVQGVSDVPGGKGVAGKADGDEDAVGIYGQSDVGYAGFFKGKVTITDHLLVKTLKVESITAANGLIGGARAKFFKIDHPLDPANKFLLHASIESNEVKNLYDGVVVLDAKGTATVTLPDWFEALNKDYRYQLTCIGGYAQVYIDQEINNGRFRIAGGRPGMKISWQVTGVRQDVHARANPMQVEQAKTPAERGKYMSPVEYGKPASAGILYTPLSASNLDFSTRRP